VAALIGGRGRSAGRNSPGGLVGELGARQCVQRSWRVKVKAISMLAVL
jgi:hypothetical protein